MTLQAAIAEYLIDQQVRGNSPKTVIYYTRCLHSFAAFVGSMLPIAQLKIVQCKQYYLHLTQQNLTSTTIQTYIRGLRAFLTWVYNEEYLAENIPARFKLPKAQRKAIDVLTDAEIQRLFACFDLRTLTGARDYAICAFMLDSGLRLNEAVTLESANLHIAEGYCIVSGKGNKQRIVPLGLHTKRALIRYTGRTELCSAGTLFVVKDTMTALKQTTVKQLFRKLKTRANIPRLHPHLLRHSFATRYLQAGGDIYSLQQILGHTSLEMVKRYVHMIPRQMLISFPQFSPLDNLMKTTKKP